MFHGPRLPSQAPLSWVEYLIEMRKAKVTEVPIHPPVRPVLENPEALELLGHILFFHGDAVYRELMKAEPSGDSSLGFAHRL